MTREERTWTALIYIAADNNLSAPGEEDQRKICDAQAVNPGADGVNSVYVGLEIDLKGKPEGSIRQEVGENGCTLIPERLDEQNTGDPATLTRFLQWGFKRFPAGKDFLVLWGHGEGFKQGVAFDDSGGALDLPGIVSALERAGAGSSSGKKLEVLGFDACLMGMVEIAYALRGHARVMVASQSEVVGSGWPLEKVLPALKQVGTGEALGEVIVSTYIQHCREDRKSGVTLSAISLEKIDDVMMALGALGRALAATEGGDWAAVGAARAQVRSFAMPDYVDLVDLCVRLEEIPAIRDVAQKAREAADRAILKSDCFGITVEGARGLSVWFPTQTEVFSRNRSSYLALAPDGGLAGWISFLDRCHAATTGTPAPT